MPGDFNDVLDAMIVENMSESDWSGRARIKVRSKVSVDLWIADSSADRSDRSLLKEFNALREVYATSPPPEAQSRGGKHPDLPDVSGEIDYPVACIECGHDLLWHREDDGWSACEHGRTSDGSLPCNCGNNTGR